MGKKDGDFLDECISGAERVGKKGATLGGVGGGVVGGVGGGAVGSSLGPVGTVVGAGAGASTGATAGASLVGTVGGVYGCLSEADWIEDLMSDVGGKKGIIMGTWDSVKGAARGVASFFGYGKKKKKGAPPPPTPLGDAVLTTMWHLEHRRRAAFEYCVPEQGAGEDAWERGDCMEWRPGDVAHVWNEANRTTLYGEAGAKTRPDLLYKGLAVQYAKIRNRRGARDDPKLVMAQAIRAYGDFLSTYYPNGQEDESRGSIEQWEPTEKARQARRRSELASKAGFVQVYEEPKGMSRGATAAAIALPLVLGVGGALWWSRKK